MSVVISDNLKHKEEEQKRQQEEEAMKQALFEEELRKRNLALAENSNTKPVNYSFFDDEPRDE